MILSKKFVILNKSIFFIEVVKSVIRIAECFFLMFCVFCEFLLFFSPQCFCWWLLCFYEKILSALYFFALFIFPLNRVRFILAMWTRAICNSLDLYFPQILIVKKHARMNVIIKSSVDHNKHDKTNNWNMTHNAHTPPLGYASLLPCLERWSSVNIYGNPHEPLWKFVYLG